MPKKKIDFYQILNESKETKTVDILIYGSIPSWDEDTWRVKNTCDQFVREFKNLEKEYDRINIRINSPGGSLYHAFPIFNTIINSKKDIHTYNDGIAASAGGVLLLAGKTIHSAKNGMLMIHNALNFIWGNAQELRDSAVVLDKYDDVIAGHFAEKSGKSKEDIKAKFLDYKDHWLTPDEAKEEGFIDEIGDYESEDMPPENILNTLDLGQVAAYYHKPENNKGFFDKLVNKVRQALNPEAKLPPVITENNDSEETENSKEEATTAHTTTTTDMDFKNSLAVLDKSQLTAEDIAAVKAEIIAFTGANEKFTEEEVTARVSEATDPLNTQISNLTTEKTNLQNQVNTLTTEKKTAEDAKALIETENEGLKADIQAYRASGVKPSTPAKETPDNLDTGDETQDDFYCEADAELKRLRAEAGITSSK